MEYRKLLTIYCMTVVAVMLFVFSSATFQHFKTHRAVQYSYLAAHCHTVTRKLTYSLLSLQHLCRKLYACTIRISPGKSISSSSQRYMFLFLLPHMYYLSLLCPKSTHSLSLFSNTLIFKRFHDRVICPCPRQKPNFLLSLRSSLFYCHPFSSSCLYRIPFTDNVYVWNFYWSPQYLCICNSAFPNDHVNDFGTFKFTKALCNSCTHHKKLQ